MSPGLVDNIRDMQRENGCTVLMVEHHIDVLMGLVDKVAVMYFGSDHRLRHPAERSWPTRSCRAPTSGRAPHEPSDRHPRGAGSALLDRRAAGRRGRHVRRYRRPGITAVLGRNGVGKTSTLRGILGLIHRRGEVTLAGERIDGLADAPHRPARGRLRARRPRGLLEAHRRREPRTRRAAAHTRAASSSTRCSPTSCSAAHRWPARSRAVSSRWSRSPERS